ncbi:MAG: hypothetical protein OXI39_14595 [Gemmatimonadota bacterium]|uniref:8-oxoguanine DNA glycosylase n=1 Tax=Candidatus Palauibacter scopulicola TaxID=3056741 RepID=UPI0023A51E22|nr:hypothetical protein [Candidatus Palauibacter scopulicola]MDE2664212.1 hypothetical protein [Candidatus Palauibacter scopulicola]
MRKAGRELSRIDEAIRVVYHELDIRPVPVWEGHSEDDLWRELVWCILGSRVHWEVSHAALGRLGRAGLLSADRWRGGLDEPEHATLLSLGRGYRFFRRTAGHIRGAAERVYDDGGSIRGLLGDGDGEDDVRRTFAAEIPGIGPKQASLYLRTIGFARRLAVLDVHVLTYLHWIGIIESGVRTINTLSRYEGLEELFMAYADKRGYSPAAFDMAVWLVVRTAKRETTLWR